MDPGKVLLVLHHPQSAENVGAAARAMKNFGLSRLAIVEPDAWSGAPRSGEGPTGRADVLARARRTARRASDVLDAAVLRPDLRAALAPVAWACGTSSRAIEGRPRLDPRALAAEVARRAAAGEVAIVFGEERRGLSDAELDLCEAVCTIPTAPAYESMNLAHAVAVVSYELAMARGGAPGAPPPERAARRETLDAVWDRARALLATVGYLNPQSPELVLAELRRLLARAEPTQREAELIAAAVRALERALRGRP
ncbi:MAG TPA: TrmH family RNA methyltransferase [Anaeromyxobacter sp.]